MKRLYSHKPRWMVGVGLLAALLYIGSSAGVSAEDTKAAAAPAADAKPKKAPVKKLTGAELYALNCNRCHPERYPTEWNATQWKTLMTHMRVRVNLPATQAREILKYLKEESGN